MLEDKHITVNSEEQLFDAISRLIDESRKQVAKAVNTAMVYTYYGVGQYIVEFEQGGKARAAYGKGVLIRLSARLKEKYGKGWSVETLTKCRKFYMVFSISSPLETKSKKIVPTGDQIHKFILPWSHYQIIMREENPQARSFYEIEAYNQQWSKRHLQRQVDSSLYERLALSRDKDEVMRLANEGETIEKPSDIIKNPLVLEFLGLKPEAAYSETQLEIVDFALQTIFADNRIEYSEVKFFKKIRSRLSITDEEILASHPDVEDFLLPDINVAEDPIWENVVFDNINFAEYEQK